MPDPGEPAIVLNAYLNQDTHKYLTQDPAVISELDQEIQVWSSLVQAYPDSRHAVEGLAALYMIKGELAQDPIWFRGAANLYIRAAAIGLSWGKIRYTDTLADLFVTLEDKPTLDTVFETILSQPPDLDPDFYYLALVDYANALAELNDDPRAAQFFQQAIAFHPENNIEAITTYTRLLLSRAAANGTAEGATLTQSAFQLLNGLTPSQRVRWVLPAYLRKIAMQQMGLDTSTADAEIARISASRDPSKFLPAAYVGGVRPGTVNDITSEILAKKPKPFIHIGLDDCRLPGSDWNEPPSWWPFCDSLWCYRFHTINVAEVLYNEIRSESPGAQDAVGWTIRDRAFENLGCDSYPGQNCSNCTLWCNAPGNFCNASKKICSVVHGGTSIPGAPHYQFKDKHVSWSRLISSGMIYVADSMLLGLIPESSPGFIQFVPSGMSDCEFSCPEGGY